jgi:hypothetical protein
VRKKKVKASSTKVNDYPENMSLYEKESLAAEATLAAQRKAEQNKQLRKNSASKTSNGKRRSS